MRTAEYWHRVAAERAALPATDVYITSLDNHEIGTRSGAVSMASCEIAARCIVGKTHRLATAEEIAALLEYEAAETAKYAAIEARKRPSVTILPDAFAEILRGGERQQVMRPGKGDK